MQRRSKQEHANKMSIPDAMTHVVQEKTGGKRQVTAATTTRSAHKNHPAIIKEPTALTVPQSQAKPLDALELQSIRKSITSWNPPMRKTVSSRDLATHTQSKDVSSNTLSTSQHNTVMPGQWQTPLRKKTAHAMSQYCQQAEQLAEKQDEKPKVENAKEQQKVRKGQQEWANTVKIEISGGPIQNSLTNLTDSHVYDNQYLAQARENQFATETEANEELDENIFSFPPNKETVFNSDSDASVVESSQPECTNDRVSLTKSNIFISKASSLEVEKNINAVGSDLSVRMIDAGLKEYVPSPKRLQVGDTNDSNDSKLSHQLPNIDSALHTPPNNPEMDFSKCSKLKRANLRKFMNDLPIQQLDNCVSGECCSEIDLFESQEDPLGEYSPPHKKIKGNCNIVNSPVPIGGLMAITSAMNENTEVAHTPPNNLEITNSQCPTIKLEKDDENMLQENDDDMLQENDDDMLQEDRELEIRKHFCEDNNLLQRGMDLQQSQLMDSIIEENALLDAVGTNSRENVNVTATGTPARALSEEKVGIVGRILDWDVAIRFRNKESQEHFNSTENTEILNATLSVDRNCADAKKIKKENVDNGNNVNRPSQTEEVHNRSTTDAAMTEKNVNELQKNTTNVTFQTPLSITEHRLFDNEDEIVISPGSNKLQKKLSPTLLVNLPSIEDSEVDCNYQGIQDIAGNTEDSNNDSKQVATEKIEGNVDPLVSELPEDPICTTQNEYSASSVNKESNTKICELALDLQSALPLANYTVQSQRVQTESCGQHLHTTDGLTDLLQDAELNVLPSTYEATVGKEVATSATILKDIHNRQNGTESVDGPWYITGQKVTDSQQCVEKDPIPLTPNTVANENSGMPAGIAKDSSIACNKENGKEGSLFVDTTETQTTDQQNVTNTGTITEEKQYDASTSHLEGCNVMNCTQIGTESVGSALYPPKVHTTNSQKLGEKDEHGYNHTEQNDEAKLLLLKENCTEREKETDENNPNIRENIPTDNPLTTSPFPVETDQEFNFSESQMMQIENDCNQEMKRKAVDATHITPQKPSTVTVKVTKYAPKEAVVAPRQSAASMSCGNARVPPAFIPTVTKVPQMQWMKTAQDDRKKLRTVIADVSRLNAMLLKVRQTVWPATRNTSNDPLDPSVTAQPLSNNLVRAAAGNDTRWVVPSNTVHAGSSHATQPNTFMHSIVPGPELGIMPRLGIGNTTRLGVGNTSNPGTSNVHHPGPGNVRHPGPGSVHHPGPGSMSHPGPGSMPHQGTSNMPYPVIGNVHNPGQGSVHYPGIGNVPYPGIGNVPYPGIGNVPYPGIGNVPHIGISNVPHTGKGNVPHTGIGNVPGSGMNHAPHSNQQNVRQMEASARRY